MAWRKSVGSVDSRLGSAFSRLSRPFTLRKALPNQSSRRLKLSAAKLAVTSSKTDNGTPPVFTFSKTRHTASLRSRPRCGRNFARRNFRQRDYIVLSCEFNWLIDGFSGKSFPAVDLAHTGLAGCQQRPEQHGGRVCRRQHGLRFDPALELLVQPFDRVRGARAAPLAWWQMRESEKTIAGFLQAVGHGFVFEPPLADEGLAVLFNLFAGFRVDHFVVVVGDLLMQALWSVREEITVFVHGAPLHRHAIPNGGDRALKPRAAIDDEELGPPQAAL